MNYVERVLHPWHILIGNKAPEIIKAIIEISKGSKMKYELDKETGLLKLDRVIYTSMHYPMNYGLVPQTYFDDGDPLDILVMCSMELEPLCLVDAKVIGIMRMEDENGIDDKIIAVADNDPSYNHINDLDDIAQHQMDELKHFFEEYKALEKKKVYVGKMYGRQEAYECVTKSINIYKEKFNPA